MGAFFLPGVSVGIGFGVAVCHLCHGAQTGVAGDRLSLELKFRPPLIEKSRQMPGYDQVRMSDTVSVGEAGAPALPWRRVILLVPDGKTVTGVSVIPGNKVAVPGVYSIEPGQRIWPLNHPLANNPGLTQANREVYEGDVAYPRQPARITAIQKKTGYSLAAVLVCPVEYNPKQRGVSYYESMELVLNLSSEKTEVLRSGQKSIARRMTEKARLRDVERIKELIDNKQDVPDTSGTTRTLRNLQSAAIGPIAVGQYDYVIITSPSLAVAFEPLREFRATHGLTAAVVTTDWIYTNYPGTRPSGGEDDATRIRNFITDAYHQWGTQYVLLGGSGHGNPGAAPIIPVRGLSDPATGSDPTQNFKDDNIPADLYYGCLDGTFDSNANGIYGEPGDGEDGGEVDLLAEVDVGRAPVSTPQEAAFFVSKTIQYENTPESAPWLESNYMLGVNFLHRNTSAAVYSTAFMEEVRLGSQSGLVTQGFLSNQNRALDAQTLYDEPGDFWAAPDLLNLINNEVHILNFDGNGVNYSDMRLVPSNLQSVSNANPFIVFSGACYSAAFDNRDENLRYTPYNSIAEQLITTASAGAVAYVGNSRYGWDFATEFYNRTFWDVLFGQGIHQLGRMNQCSKEMALPYFYFPLMRWVYLDQNLLGDPALGVHVPNRLILEPLTNSISFHELDQDFGLNIGLAAFNQDAHEVGISLSTADTNVIIEQGMADYGEIGVGQTVQSPSPGFSFRLDPSASLPYTAEFTLNIASSTYNRLKPLWVVVFKQSDRPVLNWFQFETGITNGFVISNSRHVGLNLDTSIPNPGMNGAGQMQFSNDNIDWSTPEPLVAAKVDWELSGGDGIKVVYARVANAEGAWSEVVSRPILLDTTPPTGSLAVQNRTASTVTLALSAKDASSMVQAMKFSFDGKSWGPAMAFATSKTLTLPSATATNVILVKFRDVANNWSYSISQGGPATLAIQAKPGGIVTLVMAVNRGVTYQCESSLNLVTWTVVGAPFVAEAESMTRDFELKDGGCYWRLSEIR